MANPQQNFNNNSDNRDPNAPLPHWDQNITTMWNLAVAENVHTPALAQALEQWNRSQQENRNRLREAENRWQRQEETLTTLREQQNSTMASPQETPQRTSTETTTLSQEGTIQTGTTKPYLKSSDIKKPPKYGGQVANDAARRWLQSVEEYFEAERTLAEKNPSDVQKIYYIKDFLDGTAKTMWRARSERVRDSGIEPIDTWEGFRQWILDNFKELLSEDKKWERFISCRQGNSSVANYSSRFSNMAAQIKPPLPEHLVI